MTITRFVYIVRWCLLFFVMLALVLPVLRLFRLVHISASDEGWNAYHAMQIMHGLPLYQGLMTPVNYPPLSFFLIKSLSFFGDPLFIGRVVSLLAFFSICFLVGKITKSYIYSFVCAAIFAILAPNYIGMNDPQMMGSAVMTCALYLYVTKKHNFPTMVLMAIALFIKVNILALPVAILLDSFQTSSKKGIQNLLYFSVAVGFLLLVTQLYSSNQFFYWVLIKRGYAISSIITLIKYNLLAILIPIGAIFLESKRLLKKQRILFYYLVFSLIIGLYFAGGDGTGANMLFDVYIAVTIALRYVSSRKAFAISLVTITVFLLAKLVLHTSDFNIGYQESVVKKDIAILQSKPGNALCRSIDECYFAKKAFVYDHFLMGELVITKTIPESVILAPIEAKQYPIIQLVQPINQVYFSHLRYTALQRKDTATENFYRALGNNYHLFASTDDSYFYSPN